MSLIADFSFGGPASRLLGIAKAIDRTRFDHTLASIKRTELHVDEAYGSLRDEIAASGFRMIDLGEPYSKTQSSSLLPQEIARAGWVLKDLVLQVKDLIRELRVDILDCHLQVANLVGAFAGRIAGIPTTTTLYNIPSWTPLLPRLVEQLALGISNAVITDSHSRCHVIKKWMIKPRVRGYVIPNPTFTPVSQRSEAEMRAILGLPPDLSIQVVGQIGRLVPSKGCEMLLKAARLVLDQEPKLAFLLVGYDGKSGSYRLQLQDEASRLGISERVRIVGYPGPIGDVWTVINYHVHPTLYDSLPATIIEAMSLSKPSIVTSVGGIPELVEDGLTGLIVPPNDANALAQKLLYLVRNPDAARRLGTAANQRYDKQYRPELIIREIENLFSELVAAQRSKSL